MLTDPKIHSQVDALWDKFWTGGLAANSLNALEEFAGVVARVESLPLSSFGDFVRGRISAFEPRESTRQVEGPFESLLAEVFDG
jgi:hypothetical protein